MRLIAVCDLDAERAEHARRLFGAERAYQSLDDLLARPDIDAVLVVGPPSLHVSAGLAALASGRHLFVEKPPGVTLADAVRLQEAGRAARKQVMVGFMKRHASAYRLLKDVVAAPEFGPVTSVNVTYAHWAVADLRDQLLDMSIHALDVPRWLLGDPLRLVVYRRSLHGSNALAVMLEHRDGVSQLDLSGFQPGVQERIVVTGEQALVSVENLTRLTYVREDSAVASQAANRRLVNTWTPEFALPDDENDALVLQGYAAEMIEFADAIRTDRAVSPSIDDGVAAMRLIELIADASEGVSVHDLHDATTD
jgi:predicted dehydrogenase